MKRNGWRMIDIFIERSSEVKSVKLLQLFILVCALIIFASCGADTNALNGNSSQMGSLDNLSVDVIGKDYATALEQLQVDDSQITIEEITSDLKRGTLSEKTAILDYQYEQSITFDKDIVTAIRFFTELKNDTDVSQGIEKILEQMNNLYGDTSTYPELPNRLTDYLATSEKPLPVLNQPFNFMETWTIKENVNEQENMIQQAKLSLLGAPDSNNNPLYGVEIVYQLTYDGYRSAGN